DDEQRQQREDDGLDCEEEAGHRSASRDTARSSGRVVNAAWPSPTPTATRATRIAEAAGSSATRAGRPSVGHSAASTASTAAARFRPTWRLVTGADSSPKHPHPP